MVKKDILLIVPFIIFSFNVFSQDRWGVYYDYGADEDSKYKYKYFFHFDYLEDSNSHKIEIKESNDLFVRINGFVSENLVDKYPLPLVANIYLTNLNTDSTIVLISDINNKFSITVKEGEYDLILSTMNHDKFQLKLELKKGQVINLDIKLGLAPSLHDYLIYSKDKLDEFEIKNIMKCVKENKYKFHRKCRKKNRYFIMIRL